MKHFLPIKLYGIDSIQNALLATSGISIIVNITNICGPVAVEEQPARCLARAWRPTPVVTTVAASSRSSKRRHRCYWRADLAAAAAAATDAVDADAADADAARPSSTALADIVTRSTQLTSYTAARLAMTWIM
jgi:hypothetical protein